MDAARRVFDVNVLGALAAAQAFAPAMVARGQGGLVVNVGDDATGTLLDKESDNSLSDTPGSTSDHSRFACESAAWQRAHQRSSLTATR
jgi:NAD(P)-dependent dehydrogenase (short-subunit alcohol dehydrogenase family)